MSADEWCEDGAWPVDSRVFTLDGRTYIGRDAYNAELTRRVFRKHDGGDR